MKQALFTFPEPHDLREWQRPMSLIPERVERAIALGVQTSGDLNFGDASCLLDAGGDGVTDAAVRNSDGTMTVCWRTEMPGVTPEEWDWWFGWMGGSTARYQLWHPLAHLKSAVARDQMSEPTDRLRYVGNTHVVDEYIGPDIHRLRIRFVAPETVGLNQARVDAVGTAELLRRATENTDGNEVYMCA